MIFFLLTVWYWYGFCLELEPSASTQVHCCKHRLLVLVYDTYEEPPTAPSICNTPPTAKNSNTTQWSWCVGKETKPASAHPPPESVASANLPPASTHATCQCPLGSSDLKTTRSVVQVSAVEITNSAKVAWQSLSLARPSLSAKQSNSTNLMFGDKKTGWAIWSDSLPGLLQRCCRKWRKRNRSCQDFIYLVSLIPAKFKITGSVN